MIQLNAVVISRATNGTVRFDLSVTNRYTVRIKIKIDSANMSLAY